MMHTTYPATVRVPGQDWVSLVWACCVSSIGPECGHRPSLHPDVMAAYRQQYGVDVRWDAVGCEYEVVLDILKAVTTGDKGLVKGDG